MTTATATLTIDERIAARRAALSKQRAERLDPLDYPRTWTQRQVNAYDAGTATLDKQIAAFNTTVETWAALPTLDADTKWCDFLTTTRQTINAELLAMHPRIRNEQELAHQQRLTFSIRLIDVGWAANRLPTAIIDLSSTRLGELMAAAGYDVTGLERLRGPNGFRGSLPDVEARIKALTAQRAAAQVALDVLLLTDDERAARDAESAELRAVLNRLRLKINSDGTGYVVCDEYGDVRDLATLTPAERAAFDQADGVYRREQQERLDRALGR